MTNDPTEVFSNLRKLLDCLNRLHTEMFQYEFFQHEHKDGYLLINGNPIDLALLYAVLMSNIPDYSIFMESENGKPHIKVITSKLI